MHGETFEITTPVFLIKVYKLLFLDISKSRLIRVYLLGV